MHHRTLEGATDGAIQAVEFPSADAHTALVLLPERGGGVLLGAGGLVVQARSDGAAAYAKSRLLARRSDARFLDGGSGHGYELLTRLDGRLTRVGRAVLAHAEG